MRQLGLGLNQYLAFYSYFPNAGVIFDDPQAHQGDPTRSNIYRSITKPQSFPSGKAPWLRNWVVEILPFLDQADLANAWDKSQSYTSTVSSFPNEPPNALIASTVIGILRSPNDPSISPSEGNLSYVVNGGFARWYAVPVGWSGGKADGQSANGEVLRWVAPDSAWRENLAVGKKLGVMFLGTQTGDQPWDIKNGVSDITDGMSTTLMLGENTLAGYAKGTPYSGGVPTNWACPLPNFTMFLGSDDVCRTGRSAGDCLGGQLRPPSGVGWSRANRPGTFENINYGRNLTVEGSFPFANSGHPGGANFVFCDGSTRFITDSIDGAVYAKLITPAGSRLPEEVRQSGLSAEEFGP